MTETTTALASAAFRKRYGRPPCWVVRAPGRVNLIGEHVDYNDGFVLPMAIARRTTIAAAPNDSNTITLYSEAATEAATIDLSEPLAPGARGDWLNFPKGVLAGFLALSLRPCGFDAVIHSDVPLGAGLASSASFETAMATLLEAASGVRIDSVRKAELCQQAEHAFAGVPCGIMDSFISTLGREGHALLLDCRSRECTWIPLNDPAVTVLIINTNVRHELSSSEYPARLEHCRAAAQSMAVTSLREATHAMLQRSSSSMPDTTYRCARHVINEIARTLQAAEWMRRGNWSEFGRLMYESHESLRDDYRVSCPELDIVVESARRIGPRGGLHGCRMTGGGFGGCAVALIEAAAEQTIAREISVEYMRRTGIEPMLFASHPVGGASLVIA